jgi:HemK-like putative methylase
VRTSEMMHSLTQSRLETESYTSHFANLIETDPIFKDQISLRILDLCTGTGCIPLSSYSLLSKRFSDLEVVGVDISDKALSLSRKNLEHNVAKGLLPEGAVRQVSFRKGDVLHKNFPAEIVVKEAAWDVMISNPPYISSKSFARDTARSVRNFEPRLALVPPEDPGSFEGRGDSEHLFPEDVFYGAILKVAQASESKVVLMEVADLEQALRVAMHASDLGQFRLIELWRDWPSDTAESNSIIQNHPSEPQIQYKFNIKGQGNARSVVCWL